MAVQLFTAANGGQDVENVTVAGSSSTTGNLIDFYFNNATDASDLLASLERCKLAVLQHFDSVRS